jgi:hypothetical protein
MVAPSSRTYSLGGHCDGELQGDCRDAGAGVEAQRPMLSVVMPRSVGDAMAIRTNEPDDVRNSVSQSLVLEEWLIEKFWRASSFADQGSSRRQHTSGTLRHPHHLDGNRLPCFISNYARKTWTSVSLF